MAAGDARRVALVTGAGSGIGAACARRLEADGMAVAATDLRGTGLRMDVADEAEVERVFDEVEARLGPIGVLVTCAGTMLALPDRRPDIAELALDAWETTFRVNARGTFLPVRALLRRRLARPVPNGRIVTIASAAGQSGRSSGPADYAASKAAVLALTRVAAREAAAVGMTVNAIAPGPIDTPLFHQINAREVTRAMLAAVPLARIGTPEEIAAAVAFLVSEEAGYVTGSTLDVNGGSRMQ